MKEWYANLQERERLILLVAIAVLIPLMLYLLLWEPLSKEVSSLRNSVNAGQKQVAWLQQASQEVKALNAASDTSPRQQNVSLISAVESTANQRGIRSEIKRIEPQGNNKISIEIDNAAFDEIIEWISLLQDQYGASVVQFNASGSDQPGRIQARLILERTS